MGTQWVHLTESFLGLVRWARQMSLQEIFVLPWLLCQSSKKYFFPQWPLFLWICPSCLHWPAVVQRHLSFNPFLFIQNKLLFISPEGFSALEKTLWYFLRGQCCPSSRVWQPSADSNGSLVHFFWVWACWVRCDSPLLTKMAVWWA
jgi:hypothetical protein